MNGYPFFFFFFLGSGVTICGDGAFLRIGHGDREIDAMRCKTGTRGQLRYWSSDS